MPALGISLILIAAGAILAFAVNDQVENVSLDAIGLVLLAVGAIGLLFSMLFLASWAPFRPSSHTHADVEDPHVH